MRNKMFMVSAGSAALILSGAAMAASPIPFDGWALDTTTKAVTGTCVAAATSCATTMSGDYFLQRNVIVGGTTYIQTIVTDATGFKDENFVRMTPAGAAAANGIAGKQSILDSTTTAGTVFSSTAVLNTGWAGPAAGLNRIELNQGLTQAAVNFTSNFGFSQDTNDAGAIQGKKLDLGQSVSVAQASVPGSVDDKQLFVLRERQGTFNPAPAGSFLLQSGLPLSYAVGDDVKVTWIGQGITMGSGLGAQNFGFQSYANLTSASSVQKFDLAAMGPFDDSTKPWNTTLFGAQPDYATGVFNP